jgi:hypothetical protein
MHTLYPLLLYYAVSRKLIIMETIVEIQEDPDCEEKFIREAVVDIIDGY